MQDSSASESPVPYLEFKVAALLVLMLLLVGGSVAYVMYARGVFQPTQRLVLLADDSEGVTVGMDMKFSGFPIGRVRRIELDPDGNARIVIDVPSDQAHWLRQSSVFTLERGLLGNTSIHAYSGDLGDAPLPDGAVRKVLAGDATAEIPHLVSAARDLMQNLTALTAAGAALNASLANLQATTDKLKGQHGAMGMLLGNDRDAAKLVAALDRTNALLARVDAMAAHADEQVFGTDGAVSRSRAAIGELDAALADARQTIQKLDSVLQEAQGVASNVRVATTDLGALRAEVEASLRKVEYLVDEVNRKWPFGRDTELKLP
jgi:phospholipid/cholesterol/gamma-HCH transport system substrate-binding protein